MQCPDRTRTGHWIQLDLYNSVANFGTSHFKMTKASTEAKAKAAPRPSPAWDRRTRATISRSSRAEEKKRTKATTPRPSRAGEKRTRLTRATPGGEKRPSRAGEKRARATTPRPPRARKKRTRQPETSARREGYGRADQRPTPACPPVQPVQPRRQGSRPSSTKQAYFNLADTLVEIRNSAAMGGVWHALPSNSKNMLVKLCEEQGVNRGTFMQ